MVSSGVQRGLDRRLVGSGRWVGSCPAASGRHVPVDDALGASGDSTSNSDDDVSGSSSCAANQSSSSEDDSTTSSSSGCTSSTTSVTNSEDGRALVIQPDCVCELALAAASVEAPGFATTCASVLGVGWTVQATAATLHPSFEAQGLGQWTVEALQAMKPEDMAACHVKPGHLLYSKKL